MKTFKKLKKWFRGLWLKTTGRADKYHTMEELYEHRDMLFIALCNMVILTDERGRATENGAYLGWPKYKVTRSMKNADGSKYNGYFLLEIIDTEKYGEFGRRGVCHIGYHLPNRMRHCVDGAGTVERGNSNYPTEYQTFQRLGKFPFTLRY